jgi:hypothetical protein
MDEAAAYASLRPRLQALGLDPQRVENVLAGGTPDVWYSHGAMELKWLEKWPHRPTTLARVALRPEQVAWLSRRWASGGLCWVMLRVGRELLLFSGLDARWVHAGCTKADLEEMACWRTQRGDTPSAPWPRLGWWLRGEWERLPVNEQARFLRLRCGRSLQQAEDESLGAYTVDDFRRGEASVCPTSSQLIDHWVS